MRRVLGSRLSTPPYESQRLAGEDEREFKGAAFGGDTEPRRAFMMFK
jgi:hypothetical protein